LAHRTKPHPAKQHVSKFELVLFGSERIVREPQDLRTVLHPLGIAMVTREHAATEYLSNIVRLAPVYIPRFVTWGDIGETLSFLDLLFLNG
jgi:hypothetical protein